MEIGLDQHAELVGDISSAASKELAIEQVHLSNTASRTLKQKWVICKPRFAHILSISVKRMNAGFPLIFSFM